MVLSVAAWMSVSPAGAQDDLCRRYNRLVMRLFQTAALKCGDSPGKAAIAKHILG